MKKTLSRALDKIEAQAKADRAKDLVIQQQDDALAQSEKAKDEYKAEADANNEAYLTQRDATDLARKALKAEQDRNKQLERKLSRSNTRTKLAIIAGIAAGIGTILLLK